MSGTACVSAVVATVIREKRIRIALGGVQAHADNHIGEGYGLRSGSTYVVYPNAPRVSGRADVKVGTVCRPFHPVVYPVKLKVPAASAGGPCRPGYGEVVAAVR